MTDTVKPVSLVQSGPYPQELADLVGQLSYRPSWRFELGDVVRDKTEKGRSQGLTLTVTTVGYDSYHPEKGETYRVRHTFPVPPATYNRQSWARWLLDRLIEIETHEACEFFKLGLLGLERDEDGEYAAYSRPFAPNHGPGWDPYGVRELNTVEAAETRFTGERKEGTQGMTREARPEHRAARDHRAP